MSEAERPCNVCTYLNQLSNVRCEMCGNRLIDSPPLSSIEDPIENDRKRLRSDSAVLAVDLTKRFADLNAPVISGASNSTNTPRVCSRCNVIVEDPKASICPCCDELLLVSGASNGVNSNSRVCSRCNVIVEDPKASICPCCDELLPLHASISSKKTTRKPKAVATVTEEDEEKQQIKEMIASERNPFFASELATDGIIELISESMADLDPSIKLRMCSPVPHISQIGVEGSKWSCGYRNIQMLCCSLMQDEQHRSLLFDGRGEVPDINGIQSWIERAWGEGFDTLGCQQLGYNLLGTDKWIGAVECATLLRYFGIRAIVVDFPSVELLYKLPAEQVALMLQHWVEQYFDTHLERAAEIDTVPYHIPPLYFQHDGHSRTIVGYELNTTQPSSSSTAVVAAESSSVARKGKKTPQQSPFSLYIFDPSSDGKKIKSNLLMENASWKRQVKRGMHTITKSAYQVVYIAKGIMSRPEREQSKVIVGVASSCPIDI